MNTGLERVDQAEQPLHHNNTLPSEGHTSYHNLSLVENDRHSECSGLSQVKMADETKDCDKQQRLRSRLLTWQTPIMIIGFYVTALLGAVAHLCLFMYLHRRIAVERGEKLPFKTTSLPQSYVTTLSLLLVTIFRAALVASIGICYAQYLWMVLRLQVLEVRVIEELFQIRANALRLFNPTLIRSTPTLLLVAIISWLIPVATIYPPGAMVVDLEIRQTPKVFNVSVIPKPGKLSWSRDNFALLSPEGIQYRYMGPYDPLITLAKSMLIKPQIPQIQQITSANASYTLRFPGPVMQCHEKNITKFSSIGKSDYDVSTVFYSAAFDPELEIGQARFDLKNRISPLSQLLPRPDSFLLDYALTDSTDWLTVAPCPQTDNSDTGVKYRYGLADNISLIWKVCRQECFISTAEYTVNIAIVNGVQHVQYTTSDVQSLPPLSTVDWRESPVPPAPKPLHSWEEYYNIMALVESMVVSFNYSSTSLDSFFFNQTGINMTGTHRFENGSTAKTCIAFWDLDGYLDNNPIFDISVFRPQPPKYKVAFNETFLNEVLGNITVAAISLDLWWGVVHGNVSRVYNVYHFDRRLNFFLPYSLCLLLSLPIVVAGLLALRHNGVSAIDGGFLQILMTAATGDTALERAAREGSLGGTENIPEKLEGLRVRFGELVSGEVGSAREPKSPNIAEARQPRDLERDTSIGEAASTSLLEDHERNESRGGESSQVTKVSGVSPLEAKSGLSRRAGFGTIEETIPLRRGRDISLN